MSIREYGIDDYGLMLDDAAIEHIASKFCGDYSKEDYLRDKWDFIDALSGDIFEMCSNFSGDAVIISDEGYCDWGNVVSYSDDCIFFVPLVHYPLLFSAAYKSIEDIVSEMKRKVGKYLPPDFNYRDNIRHIVGTCYG